MARIHISQYSFIGAVWPDKIPNQFRTQTSEKCVALQRASSQQRTLETYFVNPHISFQHVSASENNTSYALQYLPYPDHIRKIDSVGRLVVVQPPSLDCTTESISMKFLRLCSMLIEVAFINCPRTFKLDFFSLSGLGGRPDLDTIFDYRPSFFYAKHQQRNLPQQQKTLPYH